MFSSKDDVGLPQAEAMRQGVNYRFKVVLRNFTVYLRPLTMDETTRIVSNVAAYLATVPEVQRTPIFENFALAKETLNVASTSDENVEDPQLGNILLGKLTPDELQFIWKQYQKGLERCDPDLEDMDPETIKLLVEDIKKNPSITTDLSFWELENVCRALSQGV